MVNVVAMFIVACIVKATSHLAISMRGQRATGKIQKNNYHHDSCVPSLTGKTSSVSLNTEVTKSQRNRRRQRRLQIFLKNFTFEAWKIHVK